MKNWYGTFSFEPDELLVPQTTLLPGEQALGAEVVASDELPARVVAAEEFGKSVRAAGNAWSSLDVMAARDVVVYAGTMNRIRQYAQGEATWLDESEVMSLALLPAVKTTERRLVHVEAGIRIRDLTQKLAAPKEPGRPPWCIPNLGAATGQTLIGAISTGTHGGAFDRPPIADSVRAIRMVGPGGREYWIEPAPTRSITDPTALAAQLPGVNIRYDDEIFYSALVAVGSFGIVTEVVIEVEEMFGQSQRVRPVSWS